MTQQTSGPNCTKSGIESWLSSRLYFPQLEPQATRAVTPRKGGGSFGCAGRNIPFRKSTLQKIRPGPGETAAHTPGWRLGPQAQASHGGIFPRCAVNVNVTSVTEPWLHHIRALKLAYGLSRLSTTGRPSDLISELTYFVGDCTDATNCIEELFLTPTPDVLYGLLFCSRARFQTRAHRS